ncbi:hypothetical protein [Azospirillum sp. A39]|uniref:hypothetical protein n=1 Tax=Azospirillum sp. A39 TaxID=3462279 RepID=UPI004045C1F4
MDKRDPKRRAEPATPVDGFEAELATRIAMVIDLYDTKSAAAEVARISREQLMRQTKGLNRPFFDSLARLAAHAGVSLDWLASGEGPMFLRDRQPSTESGPVEPVDEALLSNMVDGLETYLTRRGLTLAPAKRARLEVVIYRILTIRRRDLADRGERPAEYWESGHPIDIEKDLSLGDIVLLSA